MRDGLVPDVSLGTHFFNDLVEMQVLYLALVPGKEGNCLNANFMRQAPNQLATLLPDESVWSDAVRVIDPSDVPDASTLRLHADALAQRAVCYFEAQRDKT
jgi:hypothetical protein